MTYISTDILDHYDEMIWFALEPEERERFGLPRYKTKGDKRMIAEYNPPESAKIDDDNF